MSKPSGLIPKVPHDLTLAPAAVALDRSLARLRDVAPAEIAFQIELELDRPEFGHTPKERADRVLEAVLRDVDLHGWRAEITPDRARVRMSGGSVTLDLGLSATLLAFIEG
jgi:hypothetical protein